MKDKKLVRIIGIVLFVALIAWTVSTIMGQPAAPSADALGGADSEAYKTAKAAYDAEILQGQAYLTLGVLVVIAYFFITEAFPIAISAMVIPCYYSAFGFMPFKTAFGGLVDSSVILFAGMFLVGGAMFQTGLAQKIGISCVKAAGGSETKLVLFIMIITGILSAFLSNTGTVACLLPVCLGIADSQGMNRAKLLMPLAMMASSGGMITMAGTPPNMSAAATLANNGIDIGFFDFAWAGIPIAILSIIYMMFVGNRLIPDRHSDVEAADEEAGKVYDTKKQIISGVVLIAVVIVMATGVITLETAAVIGGLLCVFTGCLTEKEAYQSIDWTTIFLFAGALGLANAMKTTGAGALLADKVIGLLGGAPNPYVLMIVLFLLAGGLTQFMSNTAAAALLCPIGLSIAQGLGADPSGVVLAIGFSCSAAYCTPVATPPNTMVYGPGGLTFMDYVKVGVPLFLLVGVACVAIIPIIWPFFP
ncbi:MAG: SLC13 family permease [Clostridium sp.]|nr:SLC13 family permease [Clostridium sp.]